MTYKPKIFTILLYRKRPPVLGSKRAKITNKHLLYNQSIILANFPPTSFSFYFPSRSLPPPTAKFQARGIQEY
jgi:hypothetical protein